MDEEKRKVITFIILVYNISIRFPGSTQHLSIPLNFHLHCLAEGLQKDELMIKTIKMCVCQMNQLKIRAKLQFRFKMNKNILFIVSSLLVGLIFGE